MSCREQSAADLNVVASEHARDWLGVPPFVTASGGALALGVFSSTIRSYENGTVLKRQFWLRGLFAEIFSERQSPHVCGLRQQLPSKVTLWWGNHGNNVEGRRSFLQQEKT